MIKEILLIFLSFLIFGCSNADDGYVTFRPVDMQEIIEMGNYTSENCHINESGDEVCIMFVEN